MAINRNIFLLKILLIFREKWREGERERNINVRETHHLSSYRALNLLLRPGPWPAIKPMTFLFVGWHPTHWATWVKANRNIFKLSLKSTRKPFFLFLSHLPAKVTFHLPRLKWNTTSSKKPVYILWGRISLSHCLIIVTLCLWIQYDIIREVCMWPSLINHDPRRQGPELVISVMLCVPHRVLPWCDICISKNHCAKQCLPI